MTRLELPEPPSVNALPSHPMQRHKAKRDYQRRTWVKACIQSPPPVNPPQTVRIDAHFRLHALRDEDNLTASLKWVFDSLRWMQADIRFRSGVYENRGYFIDDGPEYLTLGKVTQVVDRKNRGLTLTITRV